MKMSKRVKERDVYPDNDSQPLKSKTDPTKLSKEAKAAKLKEILERASRRQKEDAEHADAE